MPIKGEYCLTELKEFRNLLTPPSNSKWSQHTTAWEGLNLPERSNNGHLVPFSFVFYYIVNVTNSSSRRCVHKEILYYVHWATTWISYDPKSLWSKDNILIHLAFEWSTTDLSTPFHLRQIFQFGTGLEQEQFLEHSCTCFILLVLFWLPSVSFLNIYNIFNFLSKYSKVFSL